MDELRVNPDAVVEALKRRIGELMYENAVLSAAVDQLQADLKRGATHAGDRAQ